MKNVSETSHATVQGHVSTSLNMLRLTTLCSTNIPAVWIRGVSDVGFPIFADTDADFAF